MDNNICTLSQQLLYDIGEFIGVTLEKEILSTDAEKKRSGLYQRLQPHVAQENEFVTEEEDYEEAQPVRACSQTSSHSSSGHSDDNNKITVSFHELKRLSTKCGPLWRAEKGIIWEVWRKYLAGIYEQLLVLYMSERDTKPVACINIQGYVARPAPNVQKDPKTKDATFQLVCPGKRDYKFFARTPKDMQQWVAAICNASVQHINESYFLRLSQNPPSSTENDMETYDDASSFMDGSNTEEEVYDDIEQSHSTSEIKPKTKYLKPSDIKHVHKTSPASSDLSKSNKEYENSEPIQKQSSIPPAHDLMSSPDNEEEEVYNDIEEYEHPAPDPVLKPPPMSASDEEMYDDINERYPPVPMPVRLQPQNASLTQNQKPLPLPNSANVPADDDPEEVYNDIEDFEDHTSNLQTNLLSNLAPSVEDEEEEIYHDISDYQPQLPPKLAMNVESDKPPPLPARRPLPSLPKEESSDEEIDYDDVELPTSKELHKSEPEKLQTLAPRRPLPSLPNENTTDEEITYDDVEPTNKLPNILAAKQTQNMKPLMVEVMNVEYMNNSENQQSTESVSAELASNQGIGSMSKYENISTSETKPITTVEEEEEELYDDVGTSETSTNTHNQEICKMNANKTSNGIMNEEKHKNNSETRTKDVPNSEGNSSFLQRNFFLQNQENKQNKISSEKKNQYLREMKTDIQQQQTPARNVKNDTETKSNSEEIPKENVHKKLGQYRNNSFLHRNNSEETAGSVQSILQKFQSSDSASQINKDNRIKPPKPTSAKPPFHKPFKKPTNEKVESLATPESSTKPTDVSENNEHFQNVFKKIESSLIISNSLPKSKGLNTSHKMDKKSASSTACNLLHSENSPSTGSAQSKKVHSSKSSSSLELHRSDFNGIVGSTEPTKKPTELILLKSSPSSTSSAQKKALMSLRTEMNKNLNEPILPSASSKLSSSSKRTKPNGIAVAVPMVPETKTPLLPSPADPSPPELPPRSYLWK